MPAASLLRLLLLAALWGASFLFLRMGVPAFGVAWIIELRVAIAFVFLLVIGRWLGTKTAWRVHWRRYVMLGVLNSALPFVLYAYAARTLPASVLSILNSSAPIHGALLGLLFLGQRISALAAVGLLLGIGGVATLAVIDSAALPEGNATAFAAAILAPLCYAIAGALNKRHSAGAGAFADASGSMGVAALAVLPLCLAPWPGDPGTAAWGAALGLGVLCTGAAYVLYFRLIADVGPMRALSVTFLIPVFGTLWGVLFLDEQVRTSTLLGGALIVAGTLLTTGTVRVKPKAS